MSTSTYVTTNDALAAIEELKSNFKYGLEYIEEIENKIDIEGNLNYLIRDNSNLIGGYQSDSMVNALRILKAWLDELEGDSE